MTAKKTATKKATVKKAPAPKRVAALYVGEKVTVKRGDATVTGVVLELGMDDFCILYDADRSTRWIKNSTVIR